jgi:tetratricopeptide (TPR) repeat protein
LKLTDQQKHEYARIIADMSKAQADLLAKNKGLIIPDAVKLSRKAIDAMTATLTDEQKETLQELVGKETPAAGRGYPLGLKGPTADYYRHLLRISLLFTPKSAEELKLGEEQADLLKAAIKEAQAKLQKATPPPGGDSPQVLLSRLDQHMIDEARTEAEDEVLKPGQKRRLEQLHLQARGLAAFEDLKVLKALKLTPEQAKAIEDASKSVTKKRQEFATELGKTKSTLPEMLERLGRHEGILHQEAMPELVKGLDQAQRQAWRELTGKEFDYAGAGVIPPSADVVPARAFFNEGNAAYYRSEFDKALVGFDESLQLDGEYAPTCNSKAWLLATCPEEKYRDGLEAIRLAKKACERTQNRVASYLDTLAAAYAEAGEFEDAVKTQTRALQIAAPQERAEFAARLKLFRENKKHRETPVPISP